jgi:hypothetical protein
MRFSFASSFLFCFLAAGCQCSPVPCSHPAGEDEVCIPGGTFKMGHALLPIVKDHEAQPRNDWSPPHEVTLSAYFIDKYEVTMGIPKVPRGRCLYSGCALNFP